MVKYQKIKKEYYLIAGTIILMFASYHFAFKNTFSQWQVYRSLNKKLTMVNDVSIQPGYLKRKRVNQDTVLKIYSVDSTAFRNSVLSTVSLIAGKEKVKLLEVPSEDPFFRTDKFVIQKLIFQGDYFSLVKTLQQLQLTAGIGFIRAVTFKMPGRGQSTELKLPIMEILFLSAK